MCSYVAQPRSKEDKDDNSKTPKVTLTGVGLCQDFRSCIGQSSTAQLHLGVLGPNFAEAKVDEFQEVRVLVLIQEVLQLPQSFARNTKRQCLIQSKFHP